MHSEKPICAPPCLLEIFPTLPLNVHLTDDDPLSSFQRRSPSASSFDASLFQAIDGVMSLALFPLVVFPISR